ncbi:hypothetical protein V496_05190 [Pseudogymnoascus sp. VKM F-4515 (FW-2607)]|nr:hypothetical protein V496_05190 [Pseudogymnoascus sp. VKM F-4515 (FW-2607)]
MQNRTVIERSLRRIIQLSRYLRLTSRGSLFLPIQPDNSGRGHNHRKNSNGIASQAPPTVVSLISAYPAVLDILNHSVIARFATVRWVPHYYKRCLALKNHTPRLRSPSNASQRAFVDEPLLERLRVCATSPMSEKEVRARCQVLFAGWGQTYKSTPGMERIARLNKELPKRKQVVTQDRSKVLKETERDPFEDEEDEDVAGRSAAPSPTPGTAAKSSKSKPSSSGISSSLFSSSTTPTKSKKSKKVKGKSGPFNLDAEKGNMKTNIAESSVASINLLNAMQRINREEERVSENQTCVAQFERCKLLRRHILRYIQNVEAEEWLGALIQANDQLVTSLMTFEQLDSSIDADSDSDDELAEQAHAYRMIQEKGKSVDGTAAELAGLKLGQGSASPAPVAPPRPVAQPVADGYDSVEEEDDDNPFGDANALESPALERDEPKWRSV